MLENATSKREDMRLNRVEEMLAGGTLRQAARLLNTLTAAEIAHLLVHDGSRTWVVVALSEVEASRWLALVQGSLQVKVAAARCEAPGEPPRVRVELVPAGCAG